MPLAKVGRFAFGLPVVIAVAAAMTVSASANPGEANAEGPQQMIVVSTPSASSQTGSLTAYERNGDGWKAVIGPTPAMLGELGVGEPEDDVFRTPTGTFPLGQSFGREPNPGTRMPYFQTTDEDWWDEDVDSPTYNTHVHAAEIDSDDAENLYDSGEMYDYAVLVDHNPEDIPGHSAGIFLHVNDGDPTWGCVAIARNQMRAVLEWLDPTAHPQITIGIGLNGPPAA